MSNTFLNKLRLKSFIAARTLGYTYDYVERLYQIYLNHHKIIHFRDGYPVYSLSTPPLFSKPAANFFARSLYRTIQNKNLPNIMSFAINDICNVNCKHCSFFEGVKDAKKKVLTLEECQQVISQAQELGVSVINFVGGEPLMREDLSEIIQAVDKDLSSTAIFTNGYFLEDKIEKLKQAGLDGVYVSIDSADPQKHDLFRGKRGLFAKAIAGIGKAKTLGLTVGFSCTLTPETLHMGEMEKLLELAKKVGVHEVLFFDAMPSGRYRYRKHLVDRHDWA